MRSFRLPRQVDLINSEWGAINHLPRKSDLVRVARAAGRALRSGGYFLFDVNHRSVFERIWSEVEIRETPKLFKVQRGGYNPDRAMGWLELTWFVAQRNGLWKRFQANIEEIHWSCAEIRRILLQAGFEQVQAFDYADLMTNSKTPQGVRESVRGFKTSFLARWKRT